MSSKRLPGKSLKKIFNKPVLKFICERLKKYKKYIVILTSSNISDNAIKKFCLQNKIQCFRGNLSNVYNRFVQCLNIYKCEAFIRITGDSIMVDKNIVEKIIRKYKTKKYHIVTNTLKKTYPIGLSVEMIDSKIFLKEEKRIKSQKNKEHIFSYFYENKEKYKIFNLENKKKYVFNSYAIDTLKDFKRIKKILNEKKN